ncbi:MAG: hypothetical protein K0A99_00795 [Desulfoarculaceae bacterium]|nr:hypothetical protein [Desulfoarculaceae bacterium]
MGGESKIDQSLPVKMGAPAECVDEWNLILNVINLPDGIVAGDDPLQNFIKGAQVRS